MHNPLWLLIFPVLSVGVGYWWRSGKTAEWWNGEKSPKPFHWTGSLPLVLIIAVTQHGCSQKIAEEIRQEILESVGGDYSSPRLTREQENFLDHRYSWEHAGGAAHLGAIAGQTPAVLGEFWFGAFLCWLLNRSKRKETESATFLDESDIDQAPSSPTASGPPPDESDRPPEARSGSAEPWVVRSFGEGWKTSYYSTEGPVDDPRLAKVHTREDAEGVANSTNAESPEGAMTDEAVPRKQAIKEHDLGVGRHEDAQ
jgi:hypothetical protein